MPLANVRAVSDDTSDHASGIDDTAPRGEAPTIADDPVATARRRHGGAGAALAAGMFGLDIALGRKPREEAPVVVSASDEPVDIDADGIVVAVDELTSVVAPALPRAAPLMSTRRRTRRSR